MCCASINHQVDITMLNVPNMKYYSTTSALKGTFTPKEEDVSQCLQHQPAGGRLHYITQLFLCFSFGGNSIRIQERRFIQKADEKRNQIIDFALHY